MAALNKTEIVAELRKLGIYNDSELESYLAAYESYYSLQQNPYIEKRTFVRLPAGESVRISHENNLYAGTVLNVSEKGMFIGTNKYFLSNAMVCIENESVRVLAMVKRSIKMNGHFKGVGVELLSPAHDYIEFIKKLSPSCK